MKLFFIVIATILLSACATTQPPLAFKSGSGQPEMTFENSRIKEVKNHVIDECLNKNMEFDVGSERSLICWGPLRGPGAVATQLIIGNSYSTAPVGKISFAFTQRQDDVQVKASSWVETQMAFGQTRSMKTMTNQDKNLLYFFLKNVKNNSLKAVKKSDAD